MALLKCRSSVLKKCCLMKAHDDDDDDDDVRTFLLGTALTPGTAQKNLCIRAVQHSPKLKKAVERTIILPVVLYGCETWSLTLREERKLRVFENMVLRRIFGSRRDEVTRNGGDFITRS